MRKGGYWENTSGQLPDQRKGTTRIELGLQAWKPEQITRISRLARELRLTDQILSLDLDTMTVTQEGPAPAWTTLEGDHVAFAMDKMPYPESRVDVAVWLGTNAHELGHVLFSPRRNSQLMRRVIEGANLLMPNLHQVANIVEDQRQERLILERFAPWRAYLIAALGHHIKTDDDQAWCLVAGRTWLPDSVRAKAKARYEARNGAAVTDQLTRLIGDYQRLVDPGESQVDLAWTILMELYELLADSAGGVPTVRICVVMRDGEPETPDEGITVPVAGDPGADPGDGEGDGEGGDDTADNEDVGTGGGAGNAPRGKSNSKPKEEDESELDAIRKALKEYAEAQMQADQETRDDMDAVLDALQNGRKGQVGAEGATPQGRTIPANDNAKRLHREVSDALLDLKDSTEPGWVKRVDHGRLNVGRYATGAFDADELFDRYDAGQMDATELEVVLCVDVSGSMNHWIKPLGEATWAIRHAVDDLDGSCTVLAYDSGPHQVWAEPGVRPDDRMLIPHALGGTEPKGALRQAWEVLMDSVARNRMLVVLTDGHWYSHDGDTLIAALNAIGVTTVFAMLGGSPHWKQQTESIRGQAKLSEDIHSCQFGADIEDPAELARLFRRVATERMEAWL